MRKERHSHRRPLAPHCTEWRHAWALRILICLDRSWNSLHLPCLSWSLTAQWTKIQVKSYNKKGSWPQLGSIATCCSCQPGLFLCSLLSLWRFGFIMCTGNSDIQATSYTRYCMSRHQLDWLGWWCLMCRIAQHQQYKSRRTCTSQGRTSALASCALIALKCTYHIIRCLLASFCSELKNQQKLSRIKLCVHDNHDMLPQGIPICLESAWPLKLAMRAVAWLPGPCRCPPSLELRQHKSKGHFWSARSCGDQQECAAVRRRQAHSSSASLRANLDVWAVWGLA